MPVIKTANIGINPSSRPVGKTPGSNKGNRVQAYSHRILKINRAVIATPPGIALHSTPKELDIVQLAVGLRIGGALMAAWSNLNLKQ